MKTRISKRQKWAGELWQLHLYVAGETTKSMKALSNLTKFCESYLKGHYRITVIDLIAQPQLAKCAQILAIPTVVRDQPKPTRTMIGNFSNTERLLDSLDLRATN